MNEELLSGGLVTSGDPSYNQPGELSAAVNGFYRHDDDGLWRYPGIASSRTIASATGHAINGIVDCRFDTVHKLIAQCNGKYWVANAEDNTSAFASALSVTEGTSLQALEHSGRWFVLNGTDTNRAFTSAGTFRNMGLLPVTARPTDAGITAVAHPASATGYYDYWYTELVPIEGSETLESSYDADPLTIFVNDTAHSPILTLPTAPRNAAATAYRIYRTPASEVIITQYPVGTVIDDISITGSAISWNDGIDTRTSNACRPRSYSIYGPSTYISASGSVTASNFSMTLEGRTPAVTATAGTVAAVFYDFDWPIDQPSEWLDDYQIIVDTTIVNAYGTAGGMSSLNGPYLAVGRVRAGCTGLVLTEARTNFGDAYGLMLGNPIYASATGAFLQYYDANSKTLVDCPWPLTATGASATGLTTPTRIAGWGPDTGVPRVETTNLRTPTYHSITELLGEYNLPASDIIGAYTGTGSFVSPYGTLAATIESWIGDTYGGVYTDHYLLDHRTNIGVQNQPLRDNVTPRTRMLDSSLAIIMFVHPSWHSTAEAGVLPIKITDLTVKLRYVGDPPGSGDAYPIIQYEVGDVVASVPSHMPPPKSTTGTVFQGMAIVNDTSRPRTLCASLGENPEYFNTYYELELPTRTNDEITRIETVNDVLVIGTKGSIWKASYFPTELDAQTNRGRVMRQLSDSHNIVNVACAALFTGYSGIQELAFVSTNGVFATDGTSIRDLLRDLRWSGPDGVVGTISSSTYSKCVGLVNDPSTQTLRLFINPGDGTSQVYVANYAQRHAKQGSGLKWAGPAYVSYFAGGTRTPISCAYSYRTNNGLTVVLHGRSGTGAGCGTIAVEDGEEVTTYHNLPDASHNLLSFTTRDFYPAGKGRQVELKEAWLYGHYYTTTTNATRAPGGTFDVTQHYVNAADDTSVSDSVSSRAGTRLASLPIGSVNCDGFSISWTAELANMHALYSLVLDIDDGGDTKRA